ncbi:hypothetical protein OV450_6688 [Actinobacteria bacterium OV450]|nr:hypothetical protein OV450_6688 [Actinobacteria bacterium OV450]
MGDLGTALEFAQFGAEVVRCGDDQGLELVDRRRGGEDCALAGGEKDSQCLAFAAESGLYEVLGCQGLLRGPDGVEHVGLASAAVGCPLGPADFDDLFAGLVEEGREAGAIAAGAFQGPAAAARDVLAGEVQQAPVTAGVRRGIGAGQDCPDGTDGRCCEGVPVGIDADDAVDLFCEYGHVVVLLAGRTAVVGVGLGGVTAWRNCDESRRKADKLLIKPTGGPGRRRCPADISGERQPLTGRQLCFESCRIIGAEPGSNPSRAAEELSQLCFSRSCNGAAGLRARYDCVPSVERMTWGGVAGSVGCRRRR